MLRRPLVYSQARRPVQSRLHVHLTFREAYASKSQPGRCKLFRDQRGEQPSRGNDLLTPTSEMPDFRLHGDGHRNDQTYAVAGLVTVGRRVLDVVTSSSSNRLLFPRRGAADGRIRRPAHLSPDRRSYPYARGENCGTSPDGARVFDPSPRKPDVLIFAGCSHSVSMQSIRIRPKADHLGPPLRGAAPFPLEAAQQGQGRNPGGRHSVYMGDDRSGLSAYGHPVRAGADAGPPAGALCFSARA